MTADECMVYKAYHSFGDKKASETPNKLLQFLEIDQSFELRIDPPQPANIAN
jgi:hypothetical protein